MHNYQTYHPRPPMPPVVFAGMVLLFVAGIVAVWELAKFMVGAR